MVASGQSRAVTVGRTTRNKFTNTKAMTSLRLVRRSERHGPPEWHHTSHSFGHGLDSALLVPRSNSDLELRLLMGIQFFPNLKGGGAGRASDRLKLPGPAHKIEPGSCYREDTVQCCAVL